MLVCSLPTSSSFYKFVNADLVADTAAPSAATTGLDTAPTPISAVNELSNFSAAPDLLLDNEMWGDFGLGLSDNWDMPGSNMSWMT
jgi:hypothetical protein